MRRRLRAIGMPLVVAVVLGPAWSCGLFGPNSSPETRKQLSVLKADPVLDVEVPGTEAVSRYERAGHTDSFGAYQERPWSVSRSTSRATSRPRWTASARPPPPMVGGSSASAAHA